MFVQSKWAFLPNKERGSMVRVPKVPKVTKAPESIMEFVDRPPHTIKKVMESRFWKGLLGKLEKGDLRAPTGYERKVGIRRVEIVVTQRGFVAYITVIEETESLINKKPTMRVLKTHTEVLIEILKCLPVGKKVSRKKIVKNIMGKIKKVIPK
jgi:hypothetical protein